MGQRLLQAKLAMRAKAHKFEALVIRLTVDQNEIRPDVAASNAVLLRTVRGFSALCPAGRARRLSRG